MLEYVGLTSTSVVVSTTIGDLVLFAWDGTLSPFRIPALNGRSGIPGAPRIQTGCARTSFPDAFSGPRRDVGAMH